MACWYRETVAPNETIELRLRLARSDVETALDLAVGFDRTFADRAREADEYYASMRMADTTDEEAAVMRQAFAGMVWSQQFYHYDVARWLDGDPTQPAPPAARKTGRNANWRHLEQPRHHRHAGQVGVSVVRRMGSRVPLRRARATSIPRPQSTSCC